MKITINKEQIINGEYEGKKIEELTLLEQVRSIGDFAFFKNDITEVIIPDFVTNIGMYAFDLMTTIIYKKETYNPSIIKQYGTERIIKISQILNIAPKAITLENISIYFPKEILDTMIINNDNVKSYIANFNLFNKYCHDIESKSSIDSNYNKIAIFYKIFYLFGFFNNNNKENIYENILIFLKTNSLYKVFGVINSIELKTYNKKLMFILNEDPSNKQLLELLFKVYDNFEEISKDILAKKKIEASKMAVCYKRTQDENIKDKYNTLRKEKKKIKLSDLIRYIRLKTHLEEDNIFSSIAPILYRNVNQEDIIRMQSIYNDALTLIDNKYFESFTEKDSYVSYSWLKNIDLLNFILGYLCDCCAKMGDEGEFIIKNSMTNPFVKNLVIFESTGTILAKVTALYNHQNKAIILNGIIMPLALRKNAYIKSIVLETVLKAIRKQMSMMNEKGIDIQEIRMESFDNNVNDLLKQYPSMGDIYDNLLSDKVKERQYILYRK